MFDYKTLNRIYEMPIVNALIYFDITSWKMESEKNKKCNQLYLSLSMSFAVSESQFLHELCDTRVRSFPFVKLNSQYDALKYLRQVKPINTQHLVYNTFLGWAREMVEFFNTQCNTNPDKKNIGEPPPNSRQKQTVHWTSVEIQQWKWTRRN